MKYNYGTHPPNPFLLAQDSHIAWGIAITFGAVALGKPWWWGALAILVVALIKELTYDQFIEGQPFFWSGALDWSFYVVGVALAAGVLLFFHAR